MHAAGSLRAVGPERLGLMLRRFRIAAALSQNALAALAGIDAAYVNRMEREIHADGRPVQARPRSGVVMSLAGALELDDADRDRLLFLAGLAPVVDWQSRAEALERKLAVILGAVDEAARMPDGRTR